jgi:hypothetical protein
LSPLVMAIWSQGAILDISDKLRMEHQGQTKNITRIATPVQEERPYSCLHVRLRQSRC